HGGAVWAANFVAHLLVAVAAWVLFGGRALTSRRVDAGAVVSVPWPIHPRHQWTMVVTAAWILGVLVLRMNPGLSAFAAASVLIIGGAADDAGMVRAVPWS